jgi:hypothetical protein
VLKVTRKGREFQLTLRKNLERRKNEIGADYYPT